MDQIGEYKKIRLLGTGGMSEVYEVEHVRLGSRHALKLFTYDKDAADVRERFEVEGKLLAKLNHPRIVRVTDLGTDEASGRPYFVMDLILAESGSVRSLSDVPPGTADETEIGRWYDDLREALAYIHSNGVVHRDIKLQNVLIGPDGHAVLTDFGISKIFAPDEKGSTIVDTVNTIVKMKEGRSLVMGSVGYMAPELEMGVAASPQSDYYALGVIIYRLLTGNWCDSRTDVIGMLETYDPVWKQILPKLLHANPQGRECVSYAESRTVEQERREFEAEERWLAAKRRGRIARRSAWCLTALTIALLATTVLLGLRYGAERRARLAERGLVDVRMNPYDFDEIFSIPREAKVDEQTDAEGRLLVPSQESLANARIDMLVLTHDLFAGVRAGRLTVGGLIAEMERLAGAFDENATSAFDGWPTGYVQVGDDETARWFLEHAAERLKGLEEQ